MKPEKGYTPYIIITILGLIIGLVATTYLSSEPETPYRPQPPRPMQPPFKGKTLQFGFINPTIKDNERLIPFIEEIVVNDVNEFLDKLSYDIDIELLIDTADGQAAVHLEKIQGFRSMDINLVLGGYWDSQAQASLGYINDNDILLISPGSRSPLLSLPDDNLFRFIDPIDKQGIVLSRILADQEKTAVIVVQQGDQFSDDVFSVFERDYISRGVIWDRIRFLGNTQNYEEIVQLTQESVEEALVEYADDQVCVLLMTDGLASIAEYMLSYDVFYSVSWFGYEDTFKSSEILDLPPEITDIDLNLIHTSPTITDNAYDVIDRVTSLIDSYPAYTDMCLYDSVFVLTECVIQAQSWDASDIRDLIPTMAYNHYGVTGWTQLDENDDRVLSNYQIFTYEDKEDGIVPVVKAFFNSIDCSITAQDYYELDYLETQIVSVSESIIGANLVSMQIIEEENQTNSIELFFEGTGNIKLWFQIKQDLGEEGTRYSSPIPTISVYGNRTILVDFIDELSPIENNHHDTVYLLDPWRDTQTSKYPTIEGWVFAFTTNYDNWKESTQGYITDLSDNTYLDFDYSPELLLVGDTVFFNASNCYSPHGIEEYHWNIEVLTYSGLMVEHIFNTIGNQSVTLTIVDKAGNEMNITKLFETHLTEPEWYQPPRYAWISNVMDALIVEDKYAVLGNLMDNVNDEMYPIIEFYDRQGNMLENLTLRSDEWLFADCFINTSDGGFIIAGTYELEPQYGYTQSGFVKYDIQGDPVWNFTYSDSGHTAWKIIEKGEEYVCLVTPKYGGNGFLVTFSGNGTFIGMTSYDQTSTWYDFAPTSDGGYIFVGNMMKISKIARNRTLEWSKSYTGPSRNWGKSVLELDDGYIIAGGATTGISDCNVTVIRLDKNGNQIWMNTFGGPGWDTASDIIETSDGFIVTGQTFSFGDRGSDVYVLWISPMGELENSMVYYQDGTRFENGEKIIEGLDQTVVIATCQGENGNRPWIIILE